jgi:hypothetical protein
MGAKCPRVQVADRLTAVERDPRAQERLLDDVVRLVGAQAEPSRKAMELRATACLQVGSSR